ncbi:MAG: GspMb/PilO family protein [Verrucomicrobiota bacterium]
MKIKNREKLLTLTAAVVIGLLIGEKLVRAPLARVWTERANRITLLTKSLSQGAMMLDREKIIQERWANIQSNALPANVSAAENAVLKSVDRWARDSRISFTSIKPQWKQNAEDFMTLECRADAFGSIQSLARFLYELERDPLALKVDELEITARDSEGQQLSLSVRFSGLLLTANPR